MNGGEDHHDPEYVLGAVLAQLEDLDPIAALHVLIDATGVIIGRLS